jgi:hypothetical protein
MEVSMRRAKGRAGTAGLLGGLLILLAGTIEAAPPGASTLIAPTGVVGGSALTFAWQAVPAATFYYLQVNDATASPRLVL